ncbi:non-canonical purine NTP pyrophosphatase [Clostridium tetani]|uniref:dITP/XTP pyrophosphatase n=1 Tax=Clostridium tetani (strain Massachusetts / E88) TaxID=212717 RepID=IXTPA_CLOTE|nr:RdgB/HAM1 family non-canonical purine NTP pyrophosphatase [Clostridium tetani]Q891I4.1 RecName: Full=dITP/XTP pyrophosphatase; AltName: Full=Non-canonical purine NTP pyrophosphatase; AltName: Full=Non-standard purine NTP pyrophosphatase; AltName: Full=Nucleoside-triphosphate diphosphatase; AltName: Full=Nucleoside-triphosphate pyrophosphatase; Short=NTPase [Clostridium tetani E88]AAO36861.1 nucleoside-triphosphatase / Ham1P-like protein [Clostridium tetani E88]AVP55817.1 non-canonical purine 
MKTVLLATNNENKVNEIKDILCELNLKVVSLKEVGINVEVEEDELTFMGNALKKALTLYNMIDDKKYMVLADDSGLSVDVLGGAPGVFSARYAGEHGNSKANNEKLLEDMKGLKNRKGKFICAMALVIDKDNIIKVQGEVEGSIGYEEKGDNGFGYDPLFFVSKYNMTFAEMDKDIKNSISHRRDALNKIKEKLKSYIEDK